MSQRLYRLLVLPGTRRISIFRLKSHFYSFLTVLSLGRLTGPRRDSFLKDWLSYLPCFPCHVLPPILELGLPYIVKHVPQQANYGKWRQSLYVKRIRDLGVGSKK